MIFIFTILGFFVSIFFVSFLVMRSLKRLKLQSNLKKTYEKGDKQNALNTLLQLIEKDPYNISNRMQLVKIYMELENYKAAVIQLQEILNHGQGKVDFNEKEANLLLAECYLKLNNFEAAYNVYTFLRKIDPEDPQIYLNLGKIEITRGNIKRAIGYLTRAHQISPEDIEICKELGKILTQTQRINEAINVFQNALDINSEDPEVNFYMGELMLKYSNFNGAIKHYYKSKNDKKFTVISLLNIAKILKMFKKYEEARKVLYAALKFPQLNRDNMLEIRYELAEVYTFEKDIKSAIDQWEKILSYVSSYRDVQAKLQQYEQTKTNLNLRRYMMSSPKEFSLLCRDIANGFAQNVVIIRSEQQQDSSVEILAQTIYKGNSTTILFKFFRGTPTIGQFPIRELYEKGRELKAKLGICFTVGGYTDEAISFSEGRVLELYDKKKLLQYL